MSCCLLLKSVVSKIIYENSLKTYQWPKTRQTTCLGLLTVTSSTCHVLVHPSMLLLLLLLLLQLLQLVFDVVDVVVVVVVELAVTSKRGNQPQTM